MFYLYSDGITAPVYLFFHNYAILSVGYFSRIIESHLKILVGIQKVDFT